MQVAALAVCCSLHLSPAPIMESEYSDPGLRQKRRISSSNPMTSWQKADTFPFMLSYISIIGKGEWRQMLDTLRLRMFQFFTLDNCVWWLVDGVIQLDTTEFDFTNPSFPQSSPPPFKQKLWQTWLNYFPESVSLPSSLDLLL